MYCNRREVWGDSSPTYRRGSILAPILMKAVNIIWDVDDPADLETLPTEIEIPDGMTDEDEISDYLSDETGFCHKGFALVEN